MNAKTILFLAVTLSLSAFAADDITAPMIERLRTRLRGIEAGVMYNPYDNRYDWIRHYYCEEGGIPLSTYHAEIIAAVEEYKSQGLITRSMLKLMRESNDKSFLPFIETIATSSSADGDARASAVRVHVELCGFDSLPFIKKALEVEPANPEGNLIRYKKTVELIYELANWKPSQEQIKEVSQFLLEQAAGEKEARLLVLHDGILLWYLPVYARSWQRHELVNREDLNYLAEAPVQYFANAKREVAAIPPSELIDLRDSIPELPPLPKEKPAVAVTTETNLCDSISTPPPFPNENLTVTDAAETAQDKGFPYIWLALVAILAVSATVILNLRKTKN